MREILVRTPSRAALTRPGSAALSARYCAEKRGIAYKMPRDCALITNAPGAAIMEPRRFEKEGVRVLQNVSETGPELGRGSYGVVVELAVKGERIKYAGKKIYEEIFNDSLVVKECKIMLGLEHPNVVKFYGVCWLSPNAKYPTLVMELMPQSLEDVIENKKARLTYNKAMPILIDVSRGLCYLHCYTPKIYHRDLTARNVLLGKDMKAKITDFGNSSIITPTKVNATMTKGPGTCVYMPPEAFDVKTKYTDKLDIFSFGHLALYTAIGEFPGSLLSQKYEDSKGQLKARNEVERREPYLNKLSISLPKPDHYLYQLITQCLRDDPTKRPSATELNFWLRETVQLEKELAHNPAAATKHALALQQIQAFINKRPVEAERPPQWEQAKPKVGLIEKKSGGFLKTRDGWYAHQFKIDYNEGTFQYNRTNLFGPNTSINLADIVAFVELDSEDGTFPFEVHFRGKNSPWILRTYTEANREEWKIALQCKAMEVSGPIRVPNFTPQISEGEHIEKTVESILAEETCPAEDQTQSTPSPDLQSKVRKKPLQNIHNPPPVEWDTLEGRRMGRPTDPESENVYVDFSDHALTSPQPPPPAVRSPAVFIVPPSPRPTQSHIEGSTPRAYVNRNSKKGSEWQEPDSPYQTVEYVEPDCDSEKAYDDSVKYASIFIKPAVDNGSPYPLGRSRSLRSMSQRHHSDSDPYEPVEYTDTANGSSISNSASSPALSGNESNSSRVDDELLYEYVSEVVPPPMQMTSAPVKEKNGDRPKMDHLLPASHKKLTKTSSVPLSMPSQAKSSPSLRNRRDTFLKSDENETGSCSFQLGDRPLCPDNSNLYSTHESFECAPKQQQPKPRVPRSPSPVLRTSVPQNHTSSPAPLQRRLPAPPPLPPHRTRPQVPLGTEEESDDGIYEAIGIDKTGLSEAPEKYYTELPFQTPKVKVAIRKEEECTMEREQQSATCLLLEDLNRKALSISLSSLAHLEKIGNGQFGEVYKAEMGKINVAVKVINRFATKEVMEQFENEMSIMSRVYHHNIVQVHGILREGPYSPALVMEYSPYGDLKTFLCNEEQLTEFLLECMTDIAMGMDYLSESGLIHRDLAARNVLLDKKMTCKVSDFGLLREVPKERNAYLSKTSGPSPIRWMAPESLLHYTFSPATDVWSYGILQWEMFFPHKIPYPDMHNMQMVAQVTSGYRLATPAQCPAVASSIMVACWQEDPKERPSFKLISSILTRRDRLIS